MWSALLLLPLVQSIFEHEWIEKHTPATWNEAHRPQVHLTSPGGFVWSPQALFHHNNEYHLLYLHNPVYLFLNETYWRWAVSSDLFHWKDRGVIMGPDLDPQAEANAEGQPPVVSAGRGSVLLNFDGAVTGVDPGVVIYYTDGRPSSTAAVKRIESVKRTLLDISREAPPQRDLQKLGRTVLKTTESTNVPYWVKGRNNAFEQLRATTESDFSAPHVYTAACSSDPSASCVRMLLGNCDRVIMYESSNGADWSPKGQIGVLDYTDERTHAEFRAHDPTCSEMNNVLLTDKVWGTLGGGWIQPRLATLPVEGTGESSRDVLFVTVKGRPEEDYAATNITDGPQTGSGTMYFVLETEAERRERLEGLAESNEVLFSIKGSSDAEPQWMDYGPDFQAPALYTRSDTVPPSVMAMGWMVNSLYSDWLPTWPWRNQITLPRQLSLKRDSTTPSGYRLQSKFVDLSPLRTNYHARCQALEPIECWLTVRSPHKAFELQMSLDLTGRSTFLADIEFLPENDDEGPRIQLLKNKTDDSQEFVITRPDHGGSRAFAATSEIRVARVSREPVLTVHCVVDVGSMECIFDDGFPAVSFAYIMRSPVFGVLARIEANDTMAMYTLDNILPKKSSAARMVQFRSIGAIISTAAALSLMLLSS